MGNVGHIKSGGVQWMTAGRGVIHSEMPEQVDGRMRGFQLWINLPAAEKMKPAAYQDIQPEHIPVMHLQSGAIVKVIAGAINIEQQSVTGPIKNVTAEPIYIDVQLPPNTQFGLEIDTLHHAFIYAFEGQVQIGDQIVANHSAGILSLGNKVELKSGDIAARFLLLAGKPLHEPVVQYGPFVMNTREEIEQAIHDYQHGKLV